MTVSHRSTAVRVAGLCLAASLCACSSTENFLAGDKVDYKSGGATREQGLEVPPDLTQLSPDTKSQVARGGSVSASALDKPSTPSAAEPSRVAPQAIGDMRIVRDGSERWLVVPIPADTLWPKLEDFWKSLGFTLDVDQPAAGIMETNWAEDRVQDPAGRHPQDHRQGVRPVVLDRPARQVPHPPRNARRRAPRST